MGTLVRLDLSTLHELNAIEHLAKKLGTARFRVLALRLAFDFQIDAEESYQSIPELRDSSGIGMRHAPFEVMRECCEGFIDREPELLRILSYRYRHENRINVPRPFWLDLVDKAYLDGATLEEPPIRISDEAEYVSFAARCGDLVANKQAQIDFEFLRERQLRGVPTAVAVEELIASRGRLDASRA